MSSQNANVFKKLKGYVLDPNNVAWPEGLTALVVIIFLIGIVYFANEEHLMGVWFNSYPTIAYSFLATLGVVTQGLFSWRWHGQLPPNNLSLVREKFGILYLFFQNFLNIGLSVLGWSCGYILIFSRNLLPSDGRAIYLSLVGFIALIGMMGLLPKFIWQVVMRGNLPSR